jgi:hypothetical protein
VMIRIMPVVSVNSQLPKTPTPKMSGGNSRSDFPPVGTSHAPCESGVGDWELVYFSF